MQFSVNGEAGMTYTVEFSDDLVNWTTESSQSIDMENGSGLTGSFSYTAQGSSAILSRFYRVREGSGPPPDND